MPESRVTAGAGLSLHPDARLAGIEAASRAANALEGGEADLCVVFAAGTHMAAPETLLEGVIEALNPGALIGCGAGGVLGEGREVEDGTAVSVWAASLGDGRALPFHATASQIDEGVAITGFPELEGASAAILLPDPYSFPADGLLHGLGEQVPGIPVIGGVASARTIDGAAALFFGPEVVDEGAVGVRLDGVEVLPCVSQGAAPFGPELTITAAEGQVIAELAGQPALAKLREVVTALPDADRAKVEGGLLLGVVTGPDKPEYERGDFLVRSVVGADPDAGAVAVGAPVRVGQVVRVHARDADSAHVDLEEALDVRRAAFGDDGVAGALMFTCNGRGSHMFARRDHDAGALSTAFGDVPAAGFFAAGEIGPVGLGSFLHGFTATVAIFGR